VEPTAEHTGKNLERISYDWLILTVVRDLRSPSPRKADCHDNLYFPRLKQRRMNILVTGGAGFIGGHLAASFVDAGHDVTTLDIMEPFYDLGLKEHNIDVARQRAAETDGSYEFIEGSTTDTELVNDIVGDIDVIYHQAAQAGVRASVEEPTKVTEYNINGSQTILEAARTHDVNRVINASSSSVYGKPEYLPYDEDHPTEPVSPYGASKLAVEHYMRVYNEVYGLPTVSLRYFTVY